MNFLKITTAALFAVIMLGCQNDPIELTIEQPAGSTTALALTQTTLSGLPNADKYVRISSGDYHTVALKSDGTLWAWGRNNVGQLGDGTITSSLIPKQIESGTTWSNVSAGANHTVALKSDGTLWAWGNNTYGELGDGNTTNQLKPTQESTHVANWTSISAGGNHTIALKSDGTLWAWGWNNYGQLGDGTTDTAAHPIPTQIVNDNNWEYISAGKYHTVALKSDGTLWAWGANSYGQLGTTDNDRPTQVELDNTWTSITAGGEHTVALKADGSLWTWGRNTWGQLGNVAANSSSNPTPTQEFTYATDWTSIAAGPNHTEAIKSTGTLWAWGSNSDGQLGNGTADGVAHTTPIQESRQSINWESVSAGYDYTIALKSDGTLWAWGWNFYGQLGNSTTDSVAHSIPAQIKIGTTWQSIAAGDQHTTAIKSDGTLWTWGRNDYGQLGDSRKINKGAPTQEFTYETDWTSVSAGALFTVALKSDNTLWAWGNNDFGQLGDSTVYAHSTPMQEATHTTWTSISTGGFHTVALQSPGTLWAWGWNNYGQLGDGTQTSRSLPTREPTNAINWTSVSSGYQHTVALKSNGTLWSWGRNDYGQLGIGTADTAAHTTLTQENTNATTWSSVAAGFQHTVALDYNGTLWAWGYNEYGQLGIGTADTSTHPSPTQIGNDNNWSSVAAGAYHTIALKSDGTLWAWGYNNKGQLGDDTSTNSSSPKQIGIDTTWTSISAGAYHTVALKSDGTSWAWGDNSVGQLGIDHDTLMLTNPAYVGLKEQTNIVYEIYKHYSIGLNSSNELYMQGYNRYGQLGLGDTTARETFVKHYALAKWQQVSLGKEHAAGVQEDGTLWAWGNNQYKQLGYTTFDTYQSFTTQVNSDTNWKKVVCGDKFTVALKTDGTLWAWGDNSTGQLGLGILSLDPIVPTPFQVGNKTHWTDILAYKDALYVQKKDGTIWGAGNLIYFELLQ